MGKFKKKSTLAEKKNHSCVFLLFDHYLLYKPELYWSKKTQKKIPKQQTNQNDHWTPY